MKTIIPIFSVLVVGACSPTTNEPTQVAEDNIVAVDSTEEAPLLTEFYGGIELGDSEEEVLDKVKALEGFGPFSRGRAPTGEVYIRGEGERYDERALLSVVLDGGEAVGTIFAVNADNPIAALNVSMEVSRGLGEKYGLASKEGSAFPDPERFERLLDSPRCSALTYPTLEENWVDGQINLIHMEECKVYLTYGKRLTDRLNNAKMGISGSAERSDIEHAEL